jgi:DNA-binding MarR family transcriptional regulator
MPTDSEPHHIRFEAIIRQLTADQGFAEHEVNITVTVMQIVRAANLISQDIDRSIHRPLGWSVAGYRIMAAIYAEGPLEPTRLARVSGVSSPSVSSVLETLEKASLITRERDSPDRRTLTVHLTEAGVNAVRIASARQFRREQAWLSNLSDWDLATLSRIMRKIIAAEHAVQAEDP